MENSGRKGALALAAVMALAVTARADEVPGVYATGVGDDGLVLAVGTADPHWDIVQSADPSTPLPSAAIVAAHHPAYVPNDAVGTGGSSWVATTASTAGAAPAGLYAYQTEVDLTGFDPATAVFSGRFLSDNEVVDIVVNGVSQGSFGGAFAWWSDFTLDTDLVEGVNTIAFVVRNFGTDPMGFRVEWSATADPAVVLPPEPEVIDVDLAARPVGKPCWFRFLRTTVPVAVLSTETFDATAVQPVSVTLAGVGVAVRRTPRAWKSRWCARVPSKVAAFFSRFCGESDDDEVRYQVWQRDVDSDGRLDLVLRFPLQELPIEEGVNALEFEGVTQGGADVAGTLELVSGCR